MTVTALLVSHDGARWLPAVLDGLAEQTRPPDRLVVLDTGSTDATVALVEARHGHEVLVPLPPGTSFPEAVDRGLAETGEDDEDDESSWVWILHDDSRPAPDALERLLEAAASNPSVSTFGAKQREWPSLRRLLEVGVTMSGTGRRETGLERGEYDQGQHDRSRKVLAVSSAGMLVRRDLLALLGGFDRRLPLFGNDLDLGWRAARAGHRTMVVPDAVVFHAEAARRGARRSPLAAAPQRKERSAALYTVLVSCAAWALPLVAVRLLLGSLLRVLGFLVVRAPREAYDELLAVASTYLRPDRVLRGRSARRRTAVVPAREVRHLLAPAWVPYRHGLDFASDLVMAVAHQASDASAARRRSRPTGTEAGPVPDEAVSLPADTGVLARLLTSPTAVGLGVLVVVSLVALRDLVGGGALSGGALLAAPDSAADWWRLHLESRHDLGVGSAATAAPYVLPLALAGTAALGSAALLVELTLLLCVPLAAWGAWRLLRTMAGGASGIDRWPLMWAALTYALLPVLSGALHQGRLGTVVVAVLLPWVVHALLFLGIAHSQDRRWRAAWRSGLGLAVVTAFAPVTWLVAAAVAVVVLASSALAGDRAWRRTRAWGPVVVALAVVPALLAPWVLARDRTGGWLSEAGLAAADLVPDLGAWHLLTGRAADAGAAPAWISAGLALAAILALLRSSARRTVLTCWVVTVAGLGATVLLDARGEWSGTALLVAHGAAVTLIGVAGVGLVSRMADLSFGWRQPVALLVVLGILVAPVAGAVWWLTSGGAGPLERGPAHRLPAYMVAAAAHDRAAGTLVVGGREDELAFTLVRGPGVRLGQDSVMVDNGRQGALTTLVGDLATAPNGGHVKQLGAYGVEFVYLPPPAPSTLAGNLDSVSGLATASSPRPAARAWQLDGEPRMSLPEGSARHRGLVVLQALAVVVAVVLAVPSRRRRR